MAQDGSTASYLEPPVITAIKHDAIQTGPLARAAMERSFSQDISEGTQDLKEAAEQTRNIILDLSLDGIIRWVSPSWTDMVGTELNTVRGQKISQFISDDPTVFDTAIEALKSNDSKSHIVKFAVKVGASSDVAPMIPIEDGEKPGPENVNLDEAGRATLDLEGQGIMVYDRSSGGGTHTMWMLQPATEPVRIEIALPQKLVETLGVGAEILAKYLTELAEAGANDPENHPPPLPVLCRVCERSIIPWWFEKHSDLCVQEHRAEMDVQMVQENLSEQRHAIVKVLDAFEARQGRIGPEGSPNMAPLPEYKGQPIGPSPTTSSAVSSASASHTASPARSRSPSAAGLGHNRARSFVVRRPLVRLVELILDLCDTALEINAPSIKDSKSNSEDEFLSQSPQSESRIAQVHQWQPPISLENEPGLAALSADTERLARAKVEAVHRQQFILEYSERIRQEYMAEVDACISEALIKAERAAAGEDLSSGGSETESETEIEMDGHLEDILESPIKPDESSTEVLEPEATRSMPYVGVRSMATALRTSRDLSHIALTDQRRSSSQAVSTGSNSPIECPTPKSHKSNLITQPQPLSNRRSMYIDDGNDSDSSLPSASNWRADSPAISEHGRSAHSRDRKRRSMHLHGLNSSSPHRQQSPGRYPPPPPSPLRMNKSRVPSGENAQSPIVSPLLTTGEYMPPPHVPVLHRRQSSMHSSDIRTPSSPRLSSISQPQQRVQPPSIKDFEVIKPISRGAFGSVYLAKKKATGEYFAIKVLRKSDMIAKNQVTNVKAERAIMMWQGESDFVAKLYWTFSSKDYLYLVMEFLNGGDCASLVKILGGLSEDWAKKYIAEVVLGVEHLHSRGIVHRDLKPDNLLIDSKGHLKLTDFGLSRMGLIGRQKRALIQPDEPAPDLLKQGPFTQPSGNGSNPTSRSASFDYQGPHSPAPTPLMTPALAGGLDQPSYFSLNRESSLSRELSFKSSGHRSDSGSSFDLHNLFRKLGVQDGAEPTSHLRNHAFEEELYSQGSNSPDLFPLSQSMSNISQAPPPPPASSQMLPPPTELFDPDESGRRFVGTPDYLAPETINGQTQDEMCDWWSLGCILFEFLYGIPPFNADTTEEVFDNILHRRIAWPEDDEFEVSVEAKDLVNQLIQLDPRERLGANIEERYPTGGREIQAHPWFADINWDTLLEDEAQFIPAPEHPEDTEYFDSRGATLSSFPEELEDQISPSGPTPNGADYPNRPHDALFRARTQTASAKRGLMPLHIPPHVARDSRSRRLSEPVVADDFGNFTFKNLPVLEKANKDIVEKMRKEAMQAQARGYSHSQAMSAANSPAMGSPGPSLEGSPMMPMPVKRALSISKGHRPGSPASLATSNSSPSRPSQPSSPLLVQFSTAQHHERRKTSGSSSGSNSLLPGSFFDIPHDALKHVGTAAASPIKPHRLPAVSPAKQMQGPPSRQSSVNGRTRSQTVGSQESDGQSAREGFMPGHHKRKSQLFVRDVSPSSSDNENSQAKAILKVQRRRQSSRRMSQINFSDGPTYHPLDVLICEDHPVSRMVMERLFEKLRCRTVSASNGPDALRLAVSQIKFDIIFMEFKLPLISGVDAARMIRDTKSANTNTPIVCITGYLKDLPDVHHFDTLMQKPPTTEKLTEMLCKYCSWKPPPKDFKLAMPLQIQPITSRLDGLLTQDSPSSVASSLAPTMPDSSYKGSSREDSIGSGGFFSDMESLKADEIPVIVSRAATDDWANSGLGISDDIVMSRRPYIQSGFPHLVHTESAPPSASIEEPSGFGLRTPRRQRSSEAVRQKREQLEINLHNLNGAADEGDDEDDELGDAQVRARSPIGKSARPTSKLGIEMMRTNSRGSVISMNNDNTADSESLRKSVEILEERMESLKIPEEPPQSVLVAIQPRKTVERVASQHSHPEQTTPDRPLSRGHITPPVIFPQKPGTSVTDIAMDSELTPVPSKTINLEEEPTPKPQGSPAGQAKP
ncbi:AGC protein kinase [Exophiala aquamarina CBS 119918]|uniref:non-specific serine/threonine protein kinase n=1 Tax=Exophiala aquamarina CBS 119918 TaxID=1182545 RepID=A0A072P3C5_9EURO|nr:AGC protein kinase [Exophiala aquamarina CBS 119918]KEF54316.1 AGC protein kinase [Exophiala aquamarina CBS 119918]